VDRAGADQARDPTRLVLARPEPGDDPGRPAGPVERDRQGDLAVPRVRGHLGDLGSHRQRERDGARAVHADRVQREHGTVAEPDGDVRDIGLHRPDLNLRRPAADPDEGNRTRATRGAERRHVLIRSVGRPHGGALDDDVLLAQVGEISPSPVRDDPPALAVDGAQRDHAGRRAPARDLDRHGVALARRGRGRGGRPVHQGRNGEGSGGRHRAEPDRHGHPPSDPDRPTTAHRLVDRGRMRADRLEGRLQALVQVALVVDSH
jgi:hypothetical protein